MNREYPKVTVLVPVFNEERDIRQALSDITSLDYPDYEILIGDNASTDKTSDICQEFMNLNSNIKYFRRDRNVGGQNHVLLFKEVKTDYLAWFSGNCRVDKTYLLKCMDKLLEAPDALYANSDLQYINQMGDIINMNYTKKDSPDCSEENVVDRISSVLDLNAWYFSYGLFRTKYWDIWSSLMSANDGYNRMRQEKSIMYGFDVCLIVSMLLKAPMVHVNEVLFYYRYKYKNEQERAKNFKANDNLVFPHAELTFNIINIIKNSIDITDVERADILKNAYKIFSSSQVWLNRFKLFCDFDYANIENDDKIREQLFEMLQFVSMKPSDLFLKEQRINSRSKKRVAIFEFNHRHDEVIPSIVYQLTHMGYDVDVFMKDEDTYENKIWECFPSLKCNIHLIESEGSYDKFIYWVKAFKMIEYEFSVFNSLEPEYVLDFVKNIPGRHYSILHNPSIMMKHPKWQEYYQNPLHKHLFLHSMVTSNLPSLQRSPWFPPFLKVENVQVRKSEGSVIRFVVQGNIEPRRNYQQLLETLESLYQIRDRLPVFEVHIIGNCTCDYGVEVRNVVENQVWSDIVIFSEGELKYPEFYSKIAEADFQLFLLDKSEAKYQSYFEDKLTSSASVCFALEIAPILHEDMADLYNLSGITYNDEKDGLLHAMLYALQMSREERYEISRAIADEREKIIKQAAIMSEEFFKVSQYEKQLYYQQEALSKIKQNNLLSSRFFSNKLLRLGCNDGLAYELLATSYRVEGDKKRAVDNYILAYNISKSLEVLEDIKTLMVESNDSRLVEWGSRFALELVPRKGGGWLSRFDAYIDRDMDKIYGWVGANFHVIVKIVNELQIDMEVVGDLAEIGVHHGKFALLLDQLRNIDEKFVAVDLFDNQVLNIDSSGRGNKVIFEQNIKSYSFDPDGIKVYSADTLSLTSDFFRKLSSGYRLFSIDGGHTVEHTINDLCIVSQILAPGGVIFLDDYYNPDWPGVHEGFVKFMLHHNHNLAPFAYYQNKLLLCSISYHDIYANNFCRSIKNVGLDYKKTKMSGFEVLTVH